MNDDHHDRDNPDDPTLEAFRRRLWDECWSWAYGTAPDPLEQRRERAAVQERRRRVH